MPQWIEYHKMVGVNHFYIYDDESLDNSEEILAPYICDGTVSLITWPFHPLPLPVRLTVH
jgi:hypothetical protein